MEEKYRSAIIDMVFEYKAREEFLTSSNAKFPEGNKPFGVKDYEEGRAEIKRLMKKLGKLQPEEVGMKRFMYFFELIFKDGYSVLSHGFKSLDKATKSAEAEKATWISYGETEEIQIRYYKKEYTL